MLAVTWDITHVCIAVPDLEAATDEYGRAFGVEWCAITEPGDAPLASPLFGEGLTPAGLRYVWSTNTGRFAPPELMHARFFSPAFTLWGCPAGTSYVHHVCYWVDDLGAETAQLLENGFALEVTMPGGNPVRGMAYLRSQATGLRIELMRSEDKPAVQRRLAGGPLELNW
jgi:catechol 2,3-dioxygenase-like lactoylglutathione lyase family enzyme